MNHLIPMKNHFWLIFFSLLTAPVFSQTGSITGLVKDAETGETLPYCNVFINNTTISTVTDMDGKYTLSDLQPGQVELGFSFMGYVAETKTFTLNPGGSLTVNLSMKSLETELSYVEIRAKRDKSWERDLRKFQNLFLGNDAIAAQTEIQNPWVIDFPQSDGKNTFKATAQLPIEIINKYLGYKITFDLKEFFNSPTSYRISGAARFEEIKPDSDSQKVSWEQNRGEVYQKSPMNMFRAMLKGEHEKEGFYLYGDKAGGSESMNIRSDIFANELGKSVIPYKPEQLVTPAGKPEEYLINMKGRIEIHYEKGYTQVNTYVDAPYPVSWLEVNGGKVRVRENGMVLNPQDLVFSGDMDRKRISSLLPLDYNAEKAIQLQNLKRTAANFQEKIYIHTDKPFYFTGDEVFFKAYLKYGNPYLRDELSKVLHVELINQNRDFVIEKKFPIQDGIVVGDFYLPDSLSEEKYFLRAYTNWNRNYGPNHFFTKSLSVLSPYQRIVGENPQNLPAPSNVSLKMDRSAYGKREKVTLSIATLSSTNKPIQARLSVSVVDQTQIAVLPESPSIQESLQLEDIPSSLGLDRFSYPIEKSLVQKGMIYDDKGKGTSGEVTVFINDFQGMVELEADRNGEFSMEEMEFYGPMKLAVQASDRKQKPVSKIELIEPLKAPVALPTEATFPSTQTVSEPIRPIEEVIEEEEIEPSTEKDKKPNQTRAIYGNPDYVVSGEKILATGSSVDLVNSLVGNVPNMRVTLQGGSGRQQIRLRGGTVSVSGSMEPIVMVDGTIISSSGSSTVADNLRSINPNNIDRVEIVSRTVSMLGDQGKNGVIAVYLKDGNSQSTSPDLGKASGYTQFTIEGYGAIQNFYQLDYEQEGDLESDMRQTLYWNPYLVTDESGKVSISFYTNDQSGPITVEIRGLGIDGEVISGTFTINSN